MVSSKKEKTNCGCDQKKTKKEENFIMERPITDIEHFRQVKAFPDHPERDSLDGNLPGSSNGTCGNPPPAPTPPHNQVNQNPDGEPLPPGGNGFSKGPNAKNKKHKKLKNENGTLDYPVEKFSKKKESFEPSKVKDIEGGGYRLTSEP